MDFVLDEVKGHVYPIEIVLVGLQEMVTSFAQQERTIFFVEQEMETVV